MMRCRAEPHLFIRMTAISPTNTTNMHDNGRCSGRGNRDTVFLSAGGGGRELEAVEEFLLKISKKTACNCPEL